MTTKAEEQILVVPASLAVSVMQQSISPDIMIPPSPDRFQPAPESVLATLKVPAGFVSRGPAEENPALKQLIVYAIVMHQDRILCYKRGKVGQEARLHAKHSIGVGGHINPEDIPSGPGVEAFGVALRRELEEEAGIKDEHILDARFIGLVNEDGTDVGRVHLGLVYLVDLKTIDGLVFEEAFLEPAWLDESDMRAIDSLELWSVLIRDGIYPPTLVEPQRPAHQQRVIGEKEQLDAKLLALQKFLASGCPPYSDLPVEEQVRLARQAAIMRDYSAILGERIEAF